MAVVVVVATCNVALVGSAQAARSKPHELSLIIAEYTYGRTAASIAADDYGVKITILVGIDPRARRLSRHLRCESGKFLERSILIAVDDGISGRSGAFAHRTNDKQVQIAVTIVVGERGVPVEALDNIGRHFGEAADLGQIIAVEPVLRKARD